MHGDELSCGELYANEEFMKTFLVDFVNPICAIKTFLNRWLAEKDWAVFQVLSKLY